MGTLFRIIQALKFINFEKFIVNDLNSLNLRKWSFLVPERGVEKKIVAKQRFSGFFPCI